MPSDQLVLFATPAPNLPEGFRYRAEVLTPAEERDLLERIPTLPLKEFEFHGFTGKRRTVSYGWRYDFGDERLHRANDIPEFLLGARQKAAAFAGVDPSALQHVLVTEYAEGAGIGWHRDKGVFGDVVGISLIYIVDAEALSNSRGCSAVVAREHSDTNVSGV